MIRNIVKKLTLRPADVAIRVSNLFTLRSQNVAIRVTNLFTLRS